MIGRVGPTAAMNHNKPTIAIRLRLATMSATIATAATIAAEKMTERSNQSIMSGGGYQGDKPTGTTYWRKYCPKASRT